MFVPNTSEKTHYAYSSLNEESGEFFLLYAMLKAGAPVPGRSRRLHPLLRGIGYQTTLRLTTDDQLLRQPHDYPLHLGDVKGGNLSIQIGIGAAPGRVETDNDSFYLGDVKGIDHAITIGVAG